MRFTKDHEWVELDGDIATIGITAYAAEQLGDVVFVELPEVGKAVKAGDALAVVESVKAASDVYAPVSGEVAEANAGLADEPETVNAEPEAAGWFVKLKVADPAQVEALMDRAAYEAFLLTPRAGGPMRYLPLTPADRAEMLGVIGAASHRRSVRRRARRRPPSGPVDLPLHQGEMEVERALGALAGAEPRRPGAGRSSAAPAPIATMSRPASTTSSSARSS